MQRTVFFGLFLTVTACGVPHTAADAAREGAALEGRVVPTHAGDVSRGATATCPPGGSSQGPGAGAQGASTGSAPQGTTGANQGPASTTGGAAQAAVTGFPEPNGASLGPDSRAPIPGLPVIDVSALPASSVPVKYANLDGSERFAPSGPRYADLQANRGPTANLVDALQSIVNANPNSIAQNVALVGQTSKGFKVYAVTLFVSFDNDRPLTLRVDETYPTDDSGNPYLFPIQDPHEVDALILWPHLYLKALASYLGSYDALSTASLPLLIEAVTGRTPSTTGGVSDSFDNTRPTADLTASLQAALARGQAVFAQARDDQSLVGADPNIYVQPSFYCLAQGSTNRCVTKGLTYSIFSYDATAQMVTFRNPYRVSFGTDWNSDGTASWPLATFQKLFLDEQFGAVLVGQAPSPPPAPPLQH